MPDIFLYNLLIYDKLQQTGRLPLGYIGLFSLEEIKKEEAKFLQKNKAVSWDTLPNILLNF